MMLWKPSTIYPSERKIRRRSILPRRLALTRSPPGMTPSVLVRTNGPMQRRRRTQKNQKRQRHPIKASRPTKPRTEIKWRQSCELLPTAWRIPSIFQGPKINSNWVPVSVVFCWLCVTILTLSETFSGKEVRKAVMNSHLNAAEPVGDGFVRLFILRSRLVRHLAFLSP